MSAIYQDDDRGVREVFDIARYENPAAVATCGTCERSWDDSIVSAWTPAPSSRCPFEYEHDEDDAPDAFSLRIELGNAAMQTPDQVADALRKVADRLSDRGDFDGPEEGRIRDYNGNTVGNWTAT